MILFVSDFDLHGSGYMQIAIALCKELADRGHYVLALGLGYDGGEHNWPFSILPVRSRQVFVETPAMLQNIRQLSASGDLPAIEAMVVALDIPLQERYLTMPQRAGIPHIGIFPVESGPLTQSWANVLMAMDKALVMSHFGLQCMEEKGVPGEYIPLGIDTNAWRLPVPKERARLRRAMGYDDDRFVVLTVADNQERKNLSAGMESIKILADRGVNVEWVLVTRINSGVGWALDDMAADMGITDRVTKFERGLPFERLWMLYASSDAFLLPSKAEGLCMPVLEAMATGLPVVATDATAIPEHIYQPVAPAENGSVTPFLSRGLPIRAAFTHVDPWGNSVRTYIDPKHAADQLQRLVRMPKSQRMDLVRRARAYAESRTWNKAGDVLEQAVRAVVALPPSPVITQVSSEPETVPRIIPVRPDDLAEEVVP